MDTLQLVIDSISKIAIIPQSISQGISPQPIACLDALHKLGVVLIALFNLIFSIYLFKYSLLTLPGKNTTKKAVSGEDTAFLYFSTEIYYLFPNL